MDKIKAIAAGTYIPEDAVVQYDNHRMMESDALAGNCKWAFMCDKYKARRTEVGAHRIGGLNRVKQYGAVKVGFLIAVVLSIRKVGDDFLCELQDETGKIHGMVHRDIICDNDCQVLKGMG